MSFNPLKKIAYKLVKYIINSQFFRREIWYALKDILYSCPHDSRLRYVSDPYFSKVIATRTDETKTGRPIFITGRFRSGSTFLWSVFRNVPGLTAYYEPLNENRWFLDRRFSVDPTHVGVDDYSREYKGLHYLDKYFDRDWTYKKLYMGASDYDRNLFGYISELVGAAKGRPVLQFNRIDFRLPWIRANFENVLIINIVRNPREQWMSVLRDGGDISPNFVIKHLDGPGLFYTLAWAQDLKTIFPFLEPIGQHPYKIHYYLWRLSYIFAQIYGDYTVRYEELISKFKVVAKTLLDFLGIASDSDLLIKLASLNKGSEKERWPSYATSEWFESIEAECERVLRAYFADV